jgi:hypothetical protein
MVGVDERRAYQREERQTIAGSDPDLAAALKDEPTCVGCGCSQSLACTDGCWWAEPQLCSACDDEGIALVDLTLTAEQARHTAAFLRASVAALDEPLLGAWEHSPVGEAWAALTHAAEAATAAERNGTPASTTKEV